MNINPTPNRIKQIMAEEFEKVGGSVDQNKPYLHVSMDKLYGDELNSSFDFVSFVGLGILPDTEGRTDGFPVAGLCGGAWTERTLETAMVGVLKQFFTIATALGLSDPKLHVELAAHCSARAGAELQREHVVRTYGEDAAKFFDIVVAQAMEKMQEDMDEEDEEDAN